MFLSQDVPSVTICDTMPFALGRNELIQYI